MVTLAKTKNEIFMKITNYSENPKQGFQKSDFLFQVNHDFQCLYNLPMT